MSDMDPSPGTDLDQLFAVPGAAPVAPRPALVGPVALGEAPNLPSPEQVRQQHVFRFTQFLSKLTPVVWVTPVLVAANIAVYIWMVAAGVNPFMPTLDDLLRWGANYAPLTWRDEPWRLVTSMFVHCGILHLGLNMWGLWNIGRMLERLIGNTGVLIVYTACGIAGSLASLWWNGEVVSVGASGAIFGILGAFAAFIWNRSDSFPVQVLKPMRSSLLTCIGYNLLFGASIQGIDQACHVGGLSAGLICGALLSQPLDPLTARRRMSKNLITGVVAGLALGILFFQHPAAPADLMQEFGRYEKTIVPAVQKSEQTFKDFNARKVNPAEMIKIINTDLLPVFKEERERIEALNNIPAGWREMTHQIHTHVALREEALTALAEALKTNSLSDMQTFKEKWNQAGKMWKELATPGDSK